MMYIFMEITIKLVNVTDDAFVETDLLTDKALMIKKIKNRIETDVNLGIREVSCSETETKCIITYCNHANRNIKIVEENGAYILKWSQDNSVLYSEALNNSLSNFNITARKSGRYILIEITADNKFSDEKFDVPIIAYDDKGC